MKNAHPAKLVTVSGSGDFPIDMLRYDRAYPRTQRDSVLIQQESARREVCLVMEQEPCRPRWESFMWTVTNVEAA